MRAFAPTAIDPSFLPEPEAIVTLSFETLFDEFKTQFLAWWAIERAQNPNLPNYTTEDLESDSLITAIRPFVQGRVSDRSRVNDAYRALLAPYAKGSDLEAVVAARNLIRLTVVEATDNNPAVMESDGALLRRFLLKSDRASAGSEGGYLYDAWTAWPQSDDKAHGLWDARVNGYKIHGRRGDTDIVLIGPMGRLPTAEEIALIKNSAIFPEAVAVEFMSAKRTEYPVTLEIEVPAIGPAPELVVAEAEARVRAVATERILIGEKIPLDLMSSAAHGPNVRSVKNLGPIEIDPDPYTVPVMSDLTITSRVSNG